MRELKFRAWHKIEKKMDEVTELCTWRRLVYVSKEELSWTFNEIELMQFTGLKDKHGKEIFDGDILLIGDSAEARYYPNSVVRWKDHQWIFGTIVNWEFQGWYFEQGKVEIIGNIYETPELLTQEVTS